MKPQWTDPELVVCPLTMGVKCRIKQIVRLSEASRCMGCPYIHHCDYDDLVNQRAPTVTGSPSPVTAPLGVY